MGESLFGSMTVPGCSELLSPWDSSVLGTLWEVTAEWAHVPELSPPLLIWLGPVSCVQVCGAGFAPPLDLGTPYR